MASVVDHGWRRYYSYPAVYEQCVDGGRRSFLSFGTDYGTAEALQSGQFSVRLNPCFESGYGFSSSMMYPELFLYIPAVLCIGGVSVSTAYKFLLLCINLATAGIGYYSFRRVFDSDKLGLVCALFYLVNPYRLVNMYHRAAVGEALAQVFLPLLFWGVYELVCRDYKKWWICTAAATGIIQSHILSVEMCLIFVALFVVLAISCWWKHERAKRMLAAVKAGVAAADTVTKYAESENPFEFQNQLFSNILGERAEVFRPVQMEPVIIEGRLAFSSQKESQRISYTDV